MKKWIFASILLEFRVLSNSWNEKHPILNKLFQKLEAPIDIAPLVYARIVFGVLIGIEFSGGLFTQYSRTLIEPEFHFSYLLTPFIEPWSSAGMMQAHFVLNFVLGLLFASGFFFRWITPLFLISGASLFLMEKTLYINHFYLYSLILLLFWFLPANRAFSFDAWRNPKIKVSQVPAWTLYILLFQIAVVYTYAGFAKINADWLQAQPVQLWLSQKADYPLIGGLISTPWYAYLVAYGGLLFDLFIVPFMLYKPTRKVAFIVCCYFHVTNVMTFGVGTFPWFSIMATALFFAPGSFRKWKLKENLPPMGFKTFNYGNRKRWIYTFFAIYVVVQLLVPLRHHLYPGNPSWTEEGHFFAWRMMLRSKQSRITFLVKDSKSEKEERVNLTKYLHSRQISKMAGNPDMILQFVHFLDDVYRNEKGFESPKITVRNKVALNGREPQEMVQQGVDLTQEKRTWRPYDWIIPLKED
jgi:hypothetical protein